MRVIAMDPGKVTGVAVWRAGGLSSWELPLDQALSLIQGCVQQDPDCYLVTEHFTVDRGSLIKAGERWWSLEGNHVLRWIGRSHGTRRHENGDWIAEQASGAAKRLMTRRRLAHLGWRHPTPGGHAEDAARHAGLFLCKQGLLTAADLGPAT